MCKSNINNIREGILLKGYANVTDIMSFIPCGHGKAKKINEEIRRKVEAKGKIVYQGVRATHLLQYVELTETQVHKYAELEREKLATQKG